MKEEALKVLLRYIDNTKEANDALSELLVIFNVSGQLPLDFVKWYSGMEEEKILKAYERWKNESGNLR